MGKTIAVKVPEPIVKIEVGKGKIACHPRSLLARRCTEVTFYCDLPFAVHFGQESPFPQKSYNGKRLIKTEAIPARMPTYTRYEYFVAVYCDGQVLTVDPDIIIVPKEG